MTTTEHTAQTIAGLRRLADLIEQRPDLLDSGYLDSTIHPGPERLDLWADAIRDAGWEVRDSTTDHSRTVTSPDLGAFSAVAVHDEPYRRYLAEQAFVAAHRDEIHGVSA